MGRDEIVGIRDKKYLKCTAPWELLKTANILIDEEGCLSIAYGFGKDHYIHMNHPERALEEFEIMNYSPNDPSDLLTVKNYLLGLEEIARSEKRDIDLEKFHGILFHRDVDDSHCSDELIRLVFGVGNSTSYGLNLDSVGEHAYADFLGKKGRCYSARATIERNNLDRLMMNHMSPNVVRS